MVVLITHPNYPRVVFHVWDEPSVVERMRATCRLASKYLQPTKSELLDLVHDRLRHPLPPPSTPPTVRASRQKKSRKLTHEPADDVSTPSDIRAARGGAWAGSLLFLPDDGTGKESFRRCGYLIRRAVLWNYRKYVESCLSESLRRASEACNDALMYYEENNGHFHSLEIFISGFASTVPRLLTICAKEFLDNKKIVETVLPAAPSEATVTPPAPESKAVATSSQESTAKPQTHPGGYSRQMTKAHHIIFARDVSMSPSPISPPRIMVQLGQNVASEQEEAPEGSHMAENNSSCCPSVTALASGLTYDAEMRNQLVEDFKEPMDTYFRSRSGFWQFPDSHLMAKAKMMSLMLPGYVNVSEDLEALKLVDETDVIRLLELEAVPKSENPNPESELQTKSDVSMTEGEKKPETSPLGLSWLMQESAVDVILDGSINLDTLSSVWIKGVIGNTVGSQVEEETKTDEKIDPYHELKTECAPFLCLKLEQALPLFMDHYKIKLPSPDAVKILYVNVAVGEEKYPNSVCRLEIPIICDPVDPIELLFLDVFEMLVKTFFFDEMRTTHKVGYYIETEIVTYGKQCNLILQAESELLGCQVLARIVQFLKESLGLSSAQDADSETPSSGFLDSLEDDRFVAACKAVGSRFEASENDAEKRHSERVWDVFVQGSSSRGKRRMAVTSLKKTVTEITEKDIFGEKRAQLILDIKKRFVEFWRTRILGPDAAWVAVMCSPSGPKWTDNEALCQQWTFNLLLSKENRVKSKADEILADECGQIMLRNDLFMIKLESDMKQFHKLIFNSDKWDDARLLQYYSYTG